MKNLSDQIEEEGFAIIPCLLTPTETDGLLSVIEAVDAQVRGRGGVRNLFEVLPEVAQLACSPQIRACVQPVLGGGAFPVRAILFDKTSESNWKVPWHQDLSIAVRSRVDVAGFGPWSVKAGVPHVQPPVEVLEAMLAVRIHLDNCPLENGPLKVMAGTHRRGRLTASEIDALQASSLAQACAVPKGGAVLMRPLLLHSSSTAQCPGHRRVIHLEFASSSLPGGLRWFSERAGDGSTLHQPHPQE